MANRRDGIHTGWDDIPHCDDQFIRTAFEVAAGQVREKSGGYEYRLDRAGNGFLVNPAEPDGVQFKIIPAGTEYKVGPSYMHGGDTPDYWGPLGDEFTGQLEKTLAAGLPTRPRIAYKNYIEGRPTSLRAELDALDRLHGGDRKITRVAPPEPAPVVSRSETLQTLRRSKTAIAAPAWLPDP